ncbi:MAG: ATP-binding cassette domain-containing protein, partial [Bosea sp. (in: a-proteobacteria)]
SGGQMQRALFARLLLQDADIMLLDEPFTAIDSKTTSDLLALVQRWHDEHRTVIAVLHDLDTVRQHFPDTLLIAREAVSWGATGEVLTPSNLLKARRMIEAFDNGAAPCSRAA